MDKNTVNSHAALGLTEQKPEHKALEVIIGKWINAGETVAAPDAPSQKILTSDIYEWGSGKTYVIHNAYGRLGDMNVGGLEVITYDAARKTYLSHFFDHDGNLTTDELEISGNVWKWKGKDTGCNAEFSGNNTIQTAHHIRLENGNWAPAMEVVLIKVT